MSQAILQPGAPPPPDEWDGDHDSYNQEGSWATDGGNGSVSYGSDGGNSAEVVSREGGKRKGKKRMRKRKVRSAIYPLLKECRLEEFEQRLLDYGLVNLEDIAEEVREGSGSRPPPLPAHLTYSPHAGHRYREAAVRVRAEAGSNHPAHCQGASHSP